MVLINGKHRQSLNIADRGLQYGDGLFETLKITHGEPVHLVEHLQRLQHGCERLLIPCPALELLTEEAKQLSQQQSKAVLKIIVTRGEGGRGYRQPDTIAATRILSLHPHPDYPAQYKQQGIVARFCKTRLGLNPDLAGIKHLNRLEQVLARAEWHDPNIQEGLMLDHLGRVIEGTMSNLFFIKDHTLLTSPLNDSGIAGIQRQHILRLAHAQHIPVKEHYVMKNELLAADTLFVTNSIIGLWPIRQVAQKHFKIDEITRQLMDCLEQAE